MKKLFLSLFLGTTVGLVGLTTTQAQARPFRINNANYRYNAAYSPSYNNSNGYTYGNYPSTSYYSPSTNYSPNPYTMNGSSYYSPPATSGYYPMPGMSGTSYYGYAPGTVYQTSPGTYWVP